MGSPYNAVNANRDYETMGLPPLVLIVRDHREGANRLKALLQEHNHRVEIADNGAQGLAKARELKPDLLISDNAMSGVEGHTLCQTIKQNGELRETPFILITGPLELQDLVRALQAGADYCITEPYEPEVLLAKVKLALQTPRQPGKMGAEEGLTVNVAGRPQTILSCPQQMVRFLFSACENILDQNGQLTRVSRQLQDHNQELEDRVREGERKLQTCFTGIAETLSTLVEVRDPYTAGHSKNVAALATEIALEMGMDGNDREGLWTAAMLHDIGKVNISEGILSKAGPLTRHEWGLIREHPTTAYQILRHVPYPWPIAEVIHQHHERLDGSGYPFGLKTHQIHVWARILAVVDVVDAMMSHRPYRPKLSLSDTMNELLQGRNTLYDANIVDVCIGLLRRQTSRVLILDDDRDLVDVLAGALRLRGMHVSGFHSPRQALEAFEREPFPFVVTDLWMPEMNGLEVIRNINRIQSTTTVIVISGAGEKQHVVEAMRLGAVDFLEKPFDLDHFGNVVIRAMNLANRE